MKVIKGEPHPFGYTAQDVDEWLLSHFDVTHKGYAVEVGAYDGFSGSPTLELEQRGWTVLCIEANPNMEWYLRENRKLVWMGGASDISGRATFHVHLDGPGGYSSLKPNKSHPVWHPDPDADWKEVEVQVEPLNTLLDISGFPRLDAITIDTEGTELDVIKGLDLDRWQPKVLVAECWDDQGPHVEWMERYGYRRVERRGVDDLFLRRPSA